MSSEAMEQLLNDLAIAKQTIDDWVEDGTGHCVIRKDVIRKAVNAAIISANALKEQP